MADFMQNRADPIEPVNFGISDAVARAYQYLMEKEKLLKAPGQIMSGGIQAGAGMIQDKLANMAASLMGAQRPDPDEATNAALKKAAPAAEELGAAGRTLTDAMGSLRSGAVNAMGWKDLPQNTAPAMTPAGQTRAPRPDVRMPDVGQNPGALPAAPRRIVAPRTPGGALPAAETPFQGVQESDISMPPTPAAEGGGVNPLPPRAAEPPQKGLREQYLERISKMDAKAPAGMTDEQKGQALMEAGLAIMASASRPGASALGAVGEGGLKGTAVAREMERINRAEADKLRAEGRADVRTEFDLAGRDEDRAIRKEDKEEGRRIREDDLKERSADRKENASINARKIDLLERQLEEGRTQVIEDSATGTYSILNKVTGAVTPTKAKVKPAKDDTPAEIRLLQALRKDPGLLETYKDIKGDKGGISDKDVIAQAVELTKAQTSMGGTDNPEAVLQRNIDAVKRAAGKPVAAAPLPAGIPPGSKQVGTSKGNPVYQTPDGKKLVVTK